jgi:hypothetical protein
MMRNQDRKRKHMAANWGGVEEGDSVGLWRDEKNIYKVIKVDTVKDRYPKEKSWIEAKDICGYHRKLSWKTNSPLVIVVSDGKVTFQALYYDVKFVQKKKKGVLSAKLLELIKQ